MISEEATIFQLTTNSICNFFGYVLTTETSMDLERDKLY
jgi:hypothetical protein